jgi:hypothetical protein
MNRPVENVVVASSEKDKEVQPRRAIVSSVSEQDIDSGFPTIPDQEVICRHGKTISDLSFFVFYIGNPRSWNQDDIKLIESALAAAMSMSETLTLMIRYFPADIPGTLRGSDLLPSW